MDLEKIKKLRGLTSLGIADCKKALTDSKGNFDKALDVLKQKGVEVLAKKKGRITSQGLIESYIHFGGNLGSLVEVNCETDFVAKTDVFRQFVKELAMHIAATNPKHVAKEDVPEEVSKETADLDEYIKENCLMEQSFVKDNSKTIHEYLKEIVSQTGENVVIKRFVRFSLSENEG